MAEERYTLEEAVRVLEQRKQEDAARVAADREARAIEAKRKATEELSAFLVGKTITGVEPVLSGWRELRAIRLHLSGGAGIVEIEAEPDYDGGYELNVREGVKPR